jgi:hypothetical protein
VSNDARSGAEAAIELDSKPRRRLPLSGLSSETRERLLRGSAVSNDGLWFYAAVRAVGIEQANELNADVVRRFSALEMVRLMRHLGVTEIDGPEALRELLELALELFVGDGFQADLEAIEGKVSLRVNRCFAYDGVRRAGLEKEYRCGPGQRLLGWLTGVEAEASVTPAVGLCQMAHLGRCGYAIELADSAVSR